MKREPLAPARVRRLRRLRLRRAVLCRLPGALFWTLVVAHVLPIWLLSTFPTQDGPAHVAHVLGLFGGAAPALAPGWGLRPGWATQALFAGLASFLAPATAERVLLTGYVVLLPLAARFALPRSRRGRWAALAVFPFLYSFPFQIGSWSFSYGLVAVFTFAGVWRRSRGRLGAGRAAALSALLVVAGLCHVLAAVAALLIVVSSLAWRGALDLARTRGRPARRRVVLRALALRSAPLLVAAVPAAWMMGRFLAASEGQVTVREPLLTLAGKLVSLYALVSLDRREVLLSLPVAVALAGGVVRRLLRRANGHGGLLRPADGWLAAALACVVLYFAVPDAVGGRAEISDQLALLPFLLVVLWLGTTAGPARDVRRVAVVVALLSLAALALRAPRWWALDRERAEYASVAGALGPGEVVLPIHAAPYGLADDGSRLAWRVRVFQHEGSPGGASPFRVLSPPRGLEGDPPCVDLDRWRASGARFDAVVVFGAPAETQSGCAAAAVRELEARYTLVATSRPRGVVRVYRPDPLTAGALPRR